MQNIFSWNVRKKANSIINSHWVVSWMTFVPYDADSREHLIQKLSFKTFIRKM